MAVLDKLEPQGVFGFFEQLCSIPHGSHNTKQVSDWLVSFAEERKLRYIQDEVNNVIIFKDASAGYENAEPMLMQGHMDMVCEKAPDCSKDMAKEGLDLAVDGDKLYAVGTTLGGDDGIAVAMMLAALDDDTMQHPALECIFTVDEEVGMDGAQFIDVSMLRGRKMLNLDCEDEGHFTVSCAGGNVTKCTLPVEYAPFDGTGLSITVGGLIGGHSGVEIDKGRANANSLLGRVLCAVGGRTDIRVVSVNGGAKDNVITREAKAVIIAKDAEAVKAICTKLGAELKNEYSVTDHNVEICLKEEACSVAMDAASSEKLICMLSIFPQGIQVMSADIEGLVQTSLNLGILQTVDKAVEASFCVRSSIASQKEMLVDKLTFLMHSLGGNVSVYGDYPGWQYLQNSPLRELMIEVYKEQYGSEPIIEAIHAGVECGMFSEKLGGLDCVAIGPDLKDIHTCRETMSISSVQRVWKMVVEVLRRSK